MNRREEQLVDLIVDVLHECTCRNEDASFEDFREEVAHDEPIAVAILNIIAENEVEAGYEFGSRTAEHQDTTLPMDGKREEALKAVLKSMLPGRYGSGTKDSTHKGFYDALLDADKTARGIAEVLTIDEIGEGCDWPGFADHGWEIDRIPAREVLDERQYQAARIGEYARRRRTDAEVAALRAPGTAEEPDRIELGVHVLLSALEASADELAGTQLARRCPVGETPSERIASLPEPWQRHARRETERLAGNLHAVLDAGKGARAAPAGHRPR